MTKEPSLLYLEDTEAGPSSGTVIAKISDLPNHGGKDVLYKSEAFQTNIFVQKSDDTIHVFENRCPHAGTPLNMFGEKFLSMDGKHILCRTHGALFDKSSGKCVGGPCKGMYLRAVAFEIRGNDIISR